MNFYPQPTFDQNTFYFNFSLNPEFIYSAVHQANQLQYHPFFFSAVGSPPKIQQTLPEVASLQQNIIDKREQLLNSAHYEKKFNTKVSNSKQKRSQKKDGNIKANVIKDFVKSLKKDGASALMAKVSLNMDYPLKKFIEHLSKNFPAEQKYIRFKKLLSLCSQYEDMEFSLLLRTLFCNFLKGQYQIVILLKKKNKLEYLKICREMLQKIIALKQ